MSNDSEESDGIGGKKLALGAAILVGAVVLVRVLRGRGGEEETAEPDTTETATTDAEAAAPTDALPVDADVTSQLDEIDIVDAVYILVAGLKAAREEYRRRTDEGGA